MVLASCDSSFACVAGDNACACCPRGAGEYNVQYNGTNGVCTVSFVALEDTGEHSPRPWTGKTIRDAEGAILAVCGLIACGLLVRAVRWPIIHQVARISCVRPCLSQTTMLVCANQPVSTFVDTY